MSGPYAVGKDTILNALLSKYHGRVYRVRTLTTRPVSAEADPSYEHVSFDQMRERTANGEWIVNYQLSGRTAYATNLLEIRAAIDDGLVCIHSIYAGRNGAGQLREAFGAELYSIGLLPADGNIDEQLAVLRDRLVGRSRDDPAAVDARLKHQIEPLKYVLENPLVCGPEGGLRVFDRVLVNSDLDRTVETVVQVFDETVLEAQ